MRCEYVNWFHQTETSVWLQVFKYGNISIKDGIIYYVAEGLLLYCRYASVLMARPHYLHDLITWVLHRFWVDDLVSRIIAYAPRCTIFGFL